MNGQVPILLHARKEDPSAQTEAEKFERKALLYGNLWSMSRLRVDNSVAVRIRGFIPEGESWETGEYRFQDLGVRIKDSG